MYLFKSKKIFQSLNKFHTINHNHIKFTTCDIRFINPLNIHHEKIRIYSTSTNEVIKTPTEENKFKEKVRKPRNSTNKNFGKDAPKNTEQKVSITKVMEKLPPKEEESDNFLMVYPWMVKNELYEELVTTKKEELQEKMNKLWRKHGTKLYQDMQIIYNVVKALQYAHQPTLIQSYWNNVKKNLRWTGHQEIKAELPMVSADEMKLIRYYVGKTLFVRMDPKRIFNWLRIENVLDDSYYASILIRYYAALDDDKMVEEYYHKMISDPQSIKTSKPFSLMMFSYKKRGLYTKALEVCEQMNKYNIRKGENFYLALLNILGETRQMAKMYEAFEEMKSFKISNTQSYNVVISYSAKNKEYANMNKYIEEMIESELPLDANTFVTLIKCQESKTKVWEIYQQMINAKIHPNLSFYHSILPHDKNNFKDDSFVQKILSLMKKENIAPDVKFFNIVINSFSQRKNFAEALRYLDVMKQYGLKPDSVTYTTLIDKYLDDKNFIQANELFGMYLQEGYPLNNHLFGSLVKFSVEGNDLKEIFEKVSKFSQEPAAPFYNSFIKVCMNTHKYSLAINLINSMRKNKVELDEFTIGAHLKLFDLTIPEIQHLLEEVVESKIAMSTYLYNAFMAKYGKHSQLDMVEKLYREMVVKGLTPNVITFNTIIKHFSRLQKDYSAYMEDLKRFNIELDDISWYLITKDRIYLKGIDDTVKWIDNLGKWNSGICNALIGHYCRVKDIEQAKKVFKKAKKQPNTINSSTFISFINYFIDSNDIENAEKYYKYMKSKEIQPNIRIINSFLNYYCETKNFKKGYDIINDLKEFRLEIYPFTKKLIDRVKEGVIQDI